VSAWGEPSSPTEMRANTARSYRVAAGGVAGARMSEVYGTMTPA
jgi:hypothetical protein